MEKEGLSMSPTRLHKKDLHPDPFAQFDAWLAEAGLKSGLANPNAFTLSTRSTDGWPEARVLLLKAADARGFVFYTNFESDKGRAILAEPRVELNFFWDPLGRQVRVRGLAGRVSDAEADLYFATRPRASQLGAWASQQSREVPSRQAMDLSYQEMERKFEGREVSRPPHWSGFRVAPERFEFWQADPFRFHDRFRYAKDGARWKITRVYP
jgi:pyridoxamine 5'-phosphate oxidase